MSWFLIVWHETDGNDCTVYDTVVEAATEDEALGKLGDALEKQMDANGTEYQEDGNHLGYYFGCSDDCADDCDGHGGTSLREVTAYPTEDDARKDCSKWHSEWSID